MAITTPWRHYAPSFVDRGSLLLSIPAPPAIAESPSAEGEIRVALERWTSDFNAGQSDKVCGLFAGDLLADVRGAPERDFDTQCRLLRSALTDPERTYTYAFRLKEVLDARDKAVVRLTWTTTMRVTSTGRSKQPRTRGSMCSDAVPTATGLSSVTWPMSVPERRAEAYVTALARRYGSATTIQKRET
jgi:hypothetical protein